MRQEPYGRIGLLAKPSIAQANAKSHIAEIFCKTGAHESKFTG